MIDSDDILVDGIIDICDFLTIWLWTDRNLFEITHGIVSDIAEQAAIDELEVVFFFFKL
ncbi:hypothetical protein D3C86_1369160 [compost metagenome]